MTYKKVLFIIPPLMRKISIPFTGVGYLSTFLISNGIDNDVLDMNLGYNKSDVFKKINRFKPDLISITMMTNGYCTSYDLIAEIKGNYNIDIVVGGPHVSTLRTCILQECRADFAIKLEGEHALKDLCNGRELNEIENLIYRNDEKIIENIDADFIKDLDSLPFPTYEKFELNKYSRPNEILIISSRGCPYSCIFCPVKSCIGQVLRIRTAENVVKEISYWYERGYKTFAFQDDNFTFYKNRVLEICDLIEKGGLKDLRLSCPNGVRADKVDEVLLKSMREVGFKRLAFGVEAGNKEVLRRIKKGESIDEIETAIRNACDLGFDVVLFFLIGSPGETPRYVEDSINLALKYPITDAFFYNIIPYPQTELFTWIKEQNLFIQFPDQYLNNASAYDTEPKFATPEFPLEERKRMLKYARSIRRTIRVRSIKRRLPKWVAAKDIWAHIVASDFGENHILTNKFFLWLYGHFYPK